MSGGVGTSLNDIKTCFMPPTPDLFHIEGRLRVITVF